MQVQRLQTPQQPKVLFKQNLSPLPQNNAVSAYPVDNAENNALAPKTPSKLPLTASGIFHKGLLFGNSNHDDGIKSQLILGNKIPGSKKTESAQKLEATIETLEKAAKAKGLDFYPVYVYQMGLDKYFQVLARDGFLNRYPHWSSGQRYHELVVPHLQGYSQLREMVTNLTPANKTFILETVPLHGKKTLVANAIARSHLHKNNKHFKHLDGNFENLLTIHSQNIEEFYEKYGRDEVEQFIDKVLMIKDMINDDTSVPKKSAFETLELTPDKPVKDVMAFLAQTATEITPWQREVIAMIRDESYYMLPQRKTKVLGDGFAAFINRRINTRNPDLTDSKNLINEVQWITRNIFKMSEQSVNTYMLGEVVLKGIEKDLTYREGKKSPKVLEDFLTTLDESDSFSAIRTQLIEKHGLNYPTIKKDLLKLFNTLESYSSVKKQLEEKHAENPTQLLKELLKIVCASDQYSPIKELLTQKYGNDSIQIAQDLLKIIDDSEEYSVIKEQLIAKYGKNESQVIQELLVTVGKITEMSELRENLIYKHGKDSPKVMEDMLAIVADLDDYSMIEKYLTKEMVEDLMLYTIAPDQANNQEAKAKLKIQSKEFDQIKDSLLQQFKDNDGGAIPSVVVADAEFPVLGYNGNPMIHKSSKKEIKALLLRHEYEYDLRKDWAKEVLKNLEQMWGNPVYLKTMIKDKDEKLHPVYIRSILQNVEFVNEQGRPVNEHTGKIEPVNNNPFGGGGYPGGGY